MLSARELVSAHLFESEEDAVREALHYLLRSRPDLRIQLAVYRYQNDGLSLAKAASVAGISWAQMKDIPVIQGIDLRLGPETVQEAEQEAQTLRDYFEESQ